MGLRNRDVGGSVYVDAESHDATWLTELGLMAESEVDAADFLTLLVLLSLVDKPTSRSSLLVLQIVIVEGGGEESLAGQGQRHAAGVAGDPTPSPLLGHSRRRPAPACRVEH